MAHHSPAAFNLTVTDFAISGEIEFVEMRNPHSVIELRVANDDGSTTQWDIEFSSVNLLLRRGWDFERIKAGDRVTCIGNPSATGRVGDVHVVHRARRRHRVRTMSAQGAGARHVAYRLAAALAVTLASRAMSLQRRTLRSPESGCPTRVAANASRRNHLSPPKDDASLPTGAPAMTPSRTIPESSAKRRACRRWRSAAPTTPSKSS